MTSLMTTIAAPTTPATTPAAIDSAPLAALTHDGLATCDDDCVYCSGPETD